MQIIQSRRRFLAGLTAAGATSLVGPRRRAAPNRRPRPADSPE